MLSPLSSHDMCANFISEPIQMYQNHNYQNVVSKSYLSQNMQNALSSQTLFSGGPELSKCHYNSENIDFSAIPQQKSTTSLHH